MVALEVFDAVLIRGVDLRAVLRLSWRAARRTKTLASAH